MQGTKQIENILRHDLDNWLRWGRRRDWMPQSFVCQLGTMYVSRLSKVELDDEPAPRKLPKIDEIGAAQFERIVVSLPDRHRKAFVLHHMEKCAVNGWVVKIQGRDNMAKELGVGKSQYHVIVNEAHSIVLRKAAQINPRLR